MSFSSKAAAALLKAGPAVLVTIKQTRGSVPRESGTQMLVTTEGLLGSIGGGTLEWRAMAQAQAMLARGENFRRSNFVLGPDLGQCCGGTLVLELQRFERTEADALRAALQPMEMRRQLFLFGAGHVGRALVLVLAQCRFDIRWVDPRPQAFPGAAPENVTIDNREDALLALHGVHPGSLVLVMSHSHELDFAIVDRALRLPAIAKTGLIGSASKKGRFLSRLRQAGLAEGRTADLICPIGIDEIAAKDPYSIAISTAAQFVALDERLRLSQTEAMANVRISS
jgi:xanthine dehydrogenase accessory factor